jgi:hypothetical protein
MKKYFFKTLLAVSTLVLALTFACKKQVPDILVGFHFHTFIGGNLVDPVAFPYQWFTDSASPTPRLLNLSTAQFYVSNIAVHLYGTNTWAPISNDVILKRINNEVYQLGNIPSAAMDSVKFTVGLGNALNSQSPSSFSYGSGLDSVLSTAENFMWGTGTPGSATNVASGYTFMYIVGYDSTDHLPFNYQIGGYGDTVNVALAYAGGFNFSPVLTGGQLNLIHIVADYGKLMEAIDPFTSGNTSSTFYGTNAAPSNLLLHYIQNMFRWECGPPINC